jgi:ArsR family transcriptional regulator
MDHGTTQLIAQFKALADPVRLRIVTLCAQGECSVSELTEVLGHSQPRVSQHLKQLCGAGLLERFRDGHFVYYRVATHGDDAALRRRLLGLIPGKELAFRTDTDKLRVLRAARTQTTTDFATLERPLHRAVTWWTSAAARDAL